MQKLTDALSIELCKEGTGWVAYDQFCRHFLAPLLLKKRLDFRLHQLLRVYSDRIPLDLASKMLKRNKDFATLQHIHWHAKSTERQAKAGETRPIKKTAKTRKYKHVAQIESLIRIVENLVL